MKGRIVAPQFWRRAQARRRGIIIKICKVEGAAIREDATAVF